MGNHLFSTDPKTQGRLDKWLAKSVLTKWGILSNADVLSRWKPIAKQEGTKEYKYNRRHFNRLDAADQQRYMANLKKSEYVLINADEYQITIPKIVFDNIDLPEVAK